LPNIHSSDVPEFEHVGSRHERLGILLFLVEKRLTQRQHLRVRVSVFLGLLMLLCLAMLIVTGVTVQNVYFSGSEVRNYKALEWPWYWTLVVALVPFLMTFMHYLWITFSQMYYRGFRDITSLLDSSDFEEFRPFIHSEILAEDGSFLSVLRSVLAVDIGLTSALFTLAGMACAVIPVAVQALTSAGAAIIIWRDNVFLAVGISVFYAMFLTMSAMKTIGLFAFVRRLG